MEAQQILIDCYLRFSPCLRHNSPLNSLLSVSLVIYLSAEILHTMATSVQNPPVTILKYCKRCYSLLEFLTLNVDQLQLKERGN